MLQRSWSNQTPLTQSDPRKLPNPHLPPNQTPLTLLLQLCKLPNPNLRPDQTPLTPLLQLRKLSKPHLPPNQTPLTPLLQLRRLPSPHPNLPPNQTPPKLRRQPKPKLLGSPGTWQTCHRFEDSFHSMLLRMLSRTLDHNNHSFFIVGAAFGPRRQHLLSRTALSLSLSLSLSIYLSISLCLSFFRSLSLSLSLSLFFTLLLSLALPLSLSFII